MFNVLVQFCPKKNLLLVHSIDFWGFFHEWPWYLYVITRWYKGYNYQTKKNRKSWPIKSTLNAPVNWNRQKETAIDEYALYGIKEDLVVTIKKSLGLFCKTLKVKGKQLVLPKKKNISKLCVYIWTLQKKSPVRWSVRPE